MKTDSNGTFFGVRFRRLDLGSEPPIIHSILVQQQQDKDKKEIKENDSVTGEIVIDIEISYRGIYVFVPCLELTLTGPSFFLHLVYFSFDIYNLLGNASVQISVLKMIAGLADLRLRGTLRIILHTRETKDKNNRITKQNPSPLTLQVSPLAPHSSTLIIIIIYLTPHSPPLSPRS